MEPTLSVVESDAIGTRKSLPDISMALCKKVLLVPLHLGRRSKSTTECIYVPCIIFRSPSSRKDGRRQMPQPMTAGVKFVTVSPRTLDQSLLPISNFPMAAPTFGYFLLQHGRHFETPHYARTFLLSRLSK